MPNHPVTVVPVTLEPHPNADTLSVVKIGTGYQACVRTADFAGVDRAAFVEPDSLVDPARPYFAFLAPKARGVYGGKARVTTVKLRGVQSWGLLVAPPPGVTWALGQDVAAELGVEHYNPPEPAESPTTGGDAEAAPADLKILGKYDVDAWRKYGHIFTPDEPVYVTEKIHGASARYAYREGRMWVGSRAEWKRESDSNLWWKALRARPEIEAFCRANTDCTLYGEVFGWVQDLRYGKSQGVVDFLAFDVRRGMTWLNMVDATSAATAHGVPWVPVLAHGPYHGTLVSGMAEGPSRVPGANHVREGCVVKPAVERTHPDIGRVQLKCVGAGYLERA